jgi:D-threo-aldose 1-dehydrogenase
MTTITFPGSTTTTTTIGFGGSNLLGPRSRAEGRALLETAFDAGIRHFDVARSYSSGDAESVVGDFLKSRRNQVTITTKFGLQPPNLAGGLRPLIGLARRLMKLSPGLRKVLGDRSRQMTRSGAFGVEDARTSLEASLAALGVEHIDIYLLHEASSADCSPELLGFLNQAAAAGKIGRFGAGSEFPKVLEIARDHPEFSDVLQFENSAVFPNLKLLRNSIPAAGFTISHGTFGRSIGLVQQYLTRYPNSLNVWKKEIEADCGNPGVLAALMLGAAVKANAEGIVLFSSTRPETIRGNVRSVEEGQFTPEQLDRFVALATEIQRGEPLPPGPS